MTEKITESLVVDKLNVSIEGQPILKNINVSFPVNRITCIVGPSGCGKSTLLRCLNRLTENIDGFAIDGRVLIDGQDIVTADDEQLIELRRHVGLVPQRPCPLPMSIYDNVAYGCRIHGMHRRKQEMDETVEKYLSEVGLWDEVKDRLRRPAARLSIGQQQRLCLARSLAVEPDFILADEATSALDLAFTHFYNDVPEPFQRKPDRHSKQSQRKRRHNGHRHRSCSYSRDSRYVFVLKAFEKNVP